MSRATHEPGNDPSQAGAREDEPGLIAAVGERVRAEAARVVTVGEIALAESRLAGTSALTLLAIALVGAALAVVVWLLLMALVGLGLVTLGLGLAAALGILLLLHAAIAATLVWLAQRMLANLRFDHTLHALGGSRSSDESSDETAAYGENTERPPDPRHGGP